MEGKTKTFSRLAGILNLVMAFLLVITVLSFFTIGGMGIGESANGSAETSTTEQENSGEAENSSDNSSDTSLGEAFGGALGTAAGVGAGVIFIVLFLLLFIVPIGVIDVVSGLIIGSHCFKRAPRLGAVIYSLILKVLTILAYTIAIGLIYQLGDLVDAPVSPVFPGLFLIYMVGIVIAHVFEWMANVSSRKEVASSHVKYEEV